MNINTDFIRGIVNDKNAFPYGILIKTENADKVIDCRVVENNLIIQENLINKRNNCEVTTGGTKYVVIYTIINTQGFNSHGILNRLTFNTKEDAIEALKNQFNQVSENIPESQKVLKDTTAFMTFGGNNYYYSIEEISD